MPILNLAEEIARFMPARTGAASSTNVAGAVAAGGLLGGLLGGNNST
jgi:hypothetical protein